MKTKQYRVYIEATVRDEITVEAKNKKQAEDLALEEFQYDGEITEITVEEVLPDDEIH